MGDGLKRARAAKATQPKRITLNHEKRAELYAAIHDPITRLRINHAYAISRPTPEKMDDILRDITNEIWREQCRVLGIKRP